MKVRYTIRSSFNSADRMRTDPLQGPACSCHGAQASFYSLFAQGKAGWFPEPGQAPRGTIPGWKPSQGQEMEGIPGHCKYGTWCEIFSKGMKGLSSLLKHDYTELKMLIAVKEQENQ